MALSTNLAEKLGAALTMASSRRDVSSALTLVTNRVVDPDEMTKADGAAEACSGADAGADETGLAVCWAVRGAVPLLPLPLPRDIVVVDGRG